MINRASAQKEIQRLNKRVEELEGQLPEGMKHCTIIFEECEVGHGRLTAKNWTDNGCIMCRVQQAKQALKLTNKETDNA